MSTNVFVYGLVAHGSTPLADYAPYEGNFKQIAVRMLDQIDPKQQFSEAESNGHVFFAMTEPDRMVYLCLTEKKAPNALRKSFLEDMRTKWRTKYGNSGTTFKAYEKNSEFGPTIRLLFGTYNSDRAQKLALIKENVQKTQDQTTQNLTKALQRGEQLEIMSAKAENIKKSAQAFHREASNVKSMMCWQKWKFYIIGIIIGIVLIVIIIMLICGGPTFSKC